ncbi:PGAP1-like protein-domain-containing protein [Phyllosticta capitalensis]|uniref:GPI inositol-deacylase n=1 Tax=Phyllosticta capitalensis TaxID=121624 RepID=A0ABR1Y9G8_9PEZI
MRRRPSGSATEEDDEDNSTSTPDPAPTPTPTSSAAALLAVAPAPSRGLHPEHGHNRVGGDDLTHHRFPTSPSPRSSTDGASIPKERRRRDHDTGQARSSLTKSRAWTDTHTASTTACASALSDKDLLQPNMLTRDIIPDDMAEGYGRRRSRWRNPWNLSLLTLGTMVLAALMLFGIVQSFFTRQLDAKGCAMSQMWAAYVKFDDFDTEHTRFASKYSLYMYREGLIDEDARVKGVPVLFIPGNAGSYRQVRSLAAEAAYHYHDWIQNDPDALANGKRALDFFSVDFNEDITAFHGQTLLDQAEYLNDAVAYILSLYHNPQRSIRSGDLPDPSSVIIVGHSMGGIVARTMLTMPNYQANSINTIVTLSAPHARPPVSFDAEIVNTYKEINSYWRHAYSQQWANDNPLWHVTLISIAGGGLDTVVPSDYASTSSLVPQTHGFTVFTPSIPHVWTGMDHLAITWCDQLRKSVIRALYDVVDVSRSTQTVPRAERMRIFKKWFLTGLEDVAEKTLPHKDPRTLLTLEDNSNSIISQGERLSLRSLGQTSKPKAYLLPVPPQGAPEGRKFTLLTDQQFDASGQSGKLEVLFCSVFPLQAGQSAAIFSMDMDLSGDSTGSTRLACKNAADDIVTLPASTKESQFPFDNRQPFSYLQYDLEDLADHQFVAVVDKAAEHTSGWVIAEFSARSDSLIKTKMGLRQLLSSGLHLKLPAKRPMVMDVKIPALHSSLLAYKLRIHNKECKDEPLFTPLLRQYIQEVYESKFYVNVQEADINLHGVAPYMPPPFKRGKSSDALNALSFQLWTDPTCERPLDLSLDVDLFGSMGKLWMRYRVVFATFPLVAVALILRKQFKVYDETGVFMSFSESSNQCLRSSLPVLFIALTFFGMSFANASHGSRHSRWSPFWSGNATESALDYTKNDLLLGTQDSFFWFLVPLFGVITTGVCIAMNYVTLVTVHVLTAIFQFVKPVLKCDEGRRSPAAFAVSSTRQRVVTTGILLFMVSTFIPYHFAYMVLCIVQIATCIRALRIARETRSEANYNFYNYAHSMLILMIWILPINVPVLVVWIRNLAVHWLTPFSSHHNILSIMPFILLVETLSTGRMIPRVPNRIRYLTNALLFTLAAYAAIYGVTYAYLLHHLANILCAWLVAIHLSSTSFSHLHRLGRRYLLGGDGSSGDATKPDYHHHHSSSSSSGIGMAHVGVGHHVGGNSSTAGAGGSAAAGPGARRGGIGGNSGGLGGLGLGLGGQGKVKKRP